MAHLLVFALLLLRTFASPTPASDKVFRLSKRQNPTFGVTDGFSDLNIQQIADGFLDACSLAKAAKAAAQSGGTIFNKYFPDEAVDSVLGVFNNIIGKDTSSGNQNGDPPQQDEPCSSELSAITVRADFANENGVFSCTSPLIMGATRGGNTDNPTMILCPSGLAHGGINKGYDVGEDPPGPSAVTCHTIGDRVTWAMDTLGAVILHEYTHFGNLVAPPLGQETGDTDPDDAEIYGPIATQDIASNAFAETIADSYAWFANEAFWTLECAQTYGAPQPGDDEDPNCGNQACEDTSTDSTSSSPSS